MGLVYSFLYVNHGAAYVHSYRPILGGWRSLDRISTSTVTLTRDVVIIRQDVGGSIMTSELDGVASAMTSFRIGRGI